MRKTEIDEHIFLKAETPNQPLTDGQPVKANKIIEKNIWENNQTGKPITEKKTK